jgi:hypothetical protein
VQKHFFHRPVQRLERFRGATVGGDSEGISPFLGQQPGGVGETLGDRVVGGESFLSGHIGAHAHMMHRQT